MNKCFSLKKAIFACRFNHPKTSRADYEYVSYGEMVNKNQDILPSNDQIEPMSSTFIDTKSAKPIRHDYINPAFEISSNQIDDISHISADDCDTLCISDLEQTRKQDSFTSDISCKTDINYESLTIVKDNSKSPLNSVSNSSNPLDYSILSTAECLHSTKIESNCAEHVLPKLSPRLNKFSSNFCINDSPVSCSSRIENNSSSIVPTDADLSNLDSVISELSIQATNIESMASVCVSDYEATFVDDVTVHFADTVRILRDDNEEWLYVQVEDGQTGFIPRTIVIELNQFIEKLIEHRQQLNANKSCFPKFPMRV